MGLLGRVKLARKIQVGYRLTLFLFKPKNLGLGWVKTGRFELGQQIPAYFVMSSYHVLHYT